jgi:diacylglycerol kinase
MATWAGESEGVIERHPELSGASRPARSRILQSTLRGVRRGIRGQSNFFVYFFFAALALAGTVALEATLVDWCLLLLCVAGALTAEMFRSAINTIAGAVSEENPQLREGLEIASGAVLIAVFAASLVSVLVFVHRFGALMVWWE